MDKNSTPLPKEDLSQSYNSIFDENVIDSKTENMNRDYLYRLYNEDLNSLNKEIRMTRTEYLKKIQSFEASYAEEIKDSQKKLMIFSAVALVLLLFGVFFLVLALDANKAFSEAFSYVQTHGSSTHRDLQTVLSYRYIIPIYAFFACLFAVSGIAEFFFFGGGAIKHLVRLKKNRVHALKSIEDLKKEHMLAGTYDASR